ncbi:MAG: DUF1553 domain-containing protein, partial [Planctomycetia bacterium]
EASRAEAAAARQAYERDVLAGRVADGAAAWMPAAATAEPGWQVGTLVAAQTQSGIGFAALADGSLLAGGDPADRDVYTIEIDTALETVAAIRLDALADKTLPRGGPGRAGNGNFALSTLPVGWSPLPAAGQPAATPTPVALTAARADFSQTAPNLAVAHAIDGDRGSAWAVDPRVGASHAAAFDFAEPVTHAGGMRLSFRLEFMNNARHAIGRPRISLATRPGGAADAVADGRDPVDLVRERHDRTARLLAKPAADRTPLEQADLESLQRASDPAWRSLDEAVKRIEASRPAPELVRVLVASENVTPIPHHADGRGYPHFYKETAFLRRGDPAAKEGVAEPDVLQVLTRTPEAMHRWKSPPPTAATTSHRRAALARWITDVDAGAGHLVARVIVNRLWQHHFGQGLVATPSDFGKQGDPPTHPELLDWLAGELIRGGWRLKPIHRLIVTSQAYRQSSGVDPAKAVVDPFNRLVWRHNRRRLEAEAIRDTLLVLAGGLDPTLYGRAGRDETSPRRSLYLEVKRSKLPPFLRAFDAPDFVSGVARRSVTTTAPQALAIMNGPAVREWARRFAARAALAASASPGRTAPAASETAGDASIDAAFAIALGRPPTAEESSEAAAFLAAQTAAHAAAGRGDSLSAALADFCQVLMGLNETLHIE